MNDAEHSHDPIHATLASHAENLSGVGLVIRWSSAQSSGPVTCGRSWAGCGEGNRLSGHPVAEAWRNTMEPPGAVQWAPERWGQAEQVARPVKIS